MKKTLLLLVAIALTSAKMMAEGLTATLQQGETMTAFYGVNAFVDAYNAAEDGAVITLSEGRFNDVSSIEKSITVIGNMAFGVEGYEKTYLANDRNVTINADNVTLEGIYWSDSYSLNLGNISNCHIRRCKIGYRLSNVINTVHTNTLIDQCVIYCEDAMPTSRNYCLKNSTIGYFASSSSSEHIAYITNCYICYFATYSNSSSYQPYAIYKNCVLGMDNYNSSTSRGINLFSPSEFYNNYFYRITSYSSNYTNYPYKEYFYNGCLNNGNTNSGGKSAYVSNHYTGNYIINSFNKTGDDGTPIGITGGSGFSPYPSIPRITSKQIDSKTDSEGKLNVKITVSTEDTLVKEEKPEEGTGEETTDE